MYHLFSYFEERDKKRDVGAHTLELWKVNIDLKPHDRHTISHLQVENLEGVEELTWMSILEYWPDQPPTMHLHIIVKIPATAIQQKRVLPEPAEDIFHRLKCAKIVMTALSTTAKPEVFEPLQQELSEKIFDDCPKPDPDIPSIALLYEGFGHFLDIMDSRHDVPGLADIDIVKLQTEVDELASKMNKYYKHEDDWREAALPCLTRIFLACRGIQIPPLSAAAIGSVRGDGHNHATHSAGMMVVEFKNRITGISAIPQVELACYVARLNAMMNLTEAHRQLYLGWRVPCVGLTIVGYELAFYAIVAIDHRFKLVTLTPTFSCLQTACDGRDRRSLYSAFTAASVLQAHILQDVENLLHNLPPGPIPDHACHFPAVSRLRKYPPSSDDYLNFEIQCFFPNRQNNHLLYVAEMPDKQLVLIKFVQQYLIELHDFCAKSGHAPWILAFERLPGGWYAVTMEYIESGIPITHSTLLLAHRDHWTEELQCLMDCFHVEGLVHGDLRAANILCKEDSMRLIAFDWGGKDGEVFYPTANLNEELWEGRVFNDLRIRQEDDRHVLRNNSGTYLYAYCSSTLQCMVICRISFHLPFQSGLPNPHGGKRACGIHQC
ncbi:hypothetical protein L208DRAFT_1405999 [Tricholoma matsutake]|nr:hypothetical protein L208DRAFT_1405999 [Tricholoma matsutake 945]